MITIAIAFIVGVAIGAVGYKVAAPKVAAVETAEKAVVADVKKI